MELAKIFETASITEIIRALDEYFGKEYFTLKDIFIDKKVPKDERDLIPIFEFNDDIAWVMGIKTSDIFKVTRDTKNILQVKVQERI